MNTQNASNVKVRMEYFGPRVGAVTYHGKRKNYRFGNNAIDRYDDVNPEDVETLLKQTDFRVVGKDVQSYQAPGFDFVPEPAGEIVPEPVQEVVQSSGDETPVMDDDEWDKAIGEELPVPIFQPMPGTVKLIKKAVVGADFDTLIAWLKEEQSGKKRKTALEAIENALEDNLS